MHIYFAEIVNKNSSPATESLKFMKIKAVSLSSATDIAEDCKQANEIVTQVYTRAGFKTAHPTHHKALWHTPAVTASDTNTDDAPQPASTTTDA